mmetsp:Transcript_22814/g.56340  ORF Transcript_22814/g.56340 Transcript_22814/m.56340 type:complete len:268 (-) Transcript_22814:322-1125(-)
METDRRQKKAMERRLPRPRGSAASKAILLVAVVCVGAYFLVPSSQSPPAQLVPVGAQEDYSRRNESIPTATAQPQQQEGGAEGAAAEKVAETPAQAVVEALEELVSLSAKATSDVRGNLGVAQVVTDPSVADWLKDRWQSASDMNGTPIPAIPAKFVIDWETAHADDYTIEGRLSQTDEWKRVTTAESKGDRATSDKHVIDTVNISSEWGKQTLETNVPDLSCNAPVSAVRFVRLLIHKPATRWAPSVWRFEVHGNKIRGCAGKSRR